jgi:hypothetical protein
MMHISRYIRQFWWLVLLACALKTEAQAPRRVAFTVAGSLGAHHPSYAPLTAPMVWGVAIGAEAALVRGVVARFAATHLRSASTRNDLSICMAPEPQFELGTNCFEPNYASSYSMITTDVVVHPGWAGPLYVLGGGGWTLVSSRPYLWSTPADGGLPSGSALWRFGGGVVLGRSRRAPRLELATSRFADRVGTAKSMATVQVWMR